MSVPRPRLSQETLQLIREKVRSHIDRGWTPQIDGVDWVPFLEAIYERRVIMEQARLASREDETNAIVGGYRDFHFGEEDGSDEMQRILDELNEEASGNSEIHQPDNAAQDGQGNIVPPDSESRRRGCVQPPRRLERPPNAGPDDGWFNFLAYVPDWTAPNYDPRLIQHQSGEVRLRPHGDPLENLRPALLPTDQARNPTDYAKRWGFSGDRTDGRSAASPTCAPSRTEQFDRHSEAVARLDEETRIHLHSVTRNRATQGRPVTAPPASKGNNESESIDPDVLADWKAGRNLPVSARQLLNTAWASGLPFERFVQGLPQATISEYSPVIEEVLCEQNYQRFVFSELTMDEIVRSGIHKAPYRLPADGFNQLSDMSNEMQCDLQEDLLPLFQRFRWEDVHARRGYNAATPRFLYNLNGQQAEWDVHHNQHLWDALQPAFKLATRILKQQPLFWQAIKELRTRRWIEDDLDPSDQPRDRKLTRMVSIHQIDISQCPPAVRDLYLVYPDLDTAWGVDHILARHLELCINTGYMEPDEKPKAGTHFTYGLTYVAPSETGPTIRMELAADLIWPLLEPTFTASEKACASFTLTATILHELMHATDFALGLLLQNVFGQQTRPKVYPVGIEVMLRQCGLQLSGDEPYYVGENQSELGNAFETDTFGFVIANAVVPFEMSPTLESLSIIGKANDQAGMPYPEPNDKILLSNTPVQMFSLFVPVAYYTRLYSESFWQNEYARGGPRVLRMMPTPLDPSISTAASLFATAAGMKFQASDLLQNQTFSVEFYLMLEYITFHLDKARLKALSHYVSYRLYELRTIEVFEIRMRRERQYWRQVDSESIDPVFDNVHQTFQELDELRQVIETAQPSNYHSRFMQTNRREWDNWVLNSRSQVFIGFEELQFRLLRELRMMERLLFEWFKMASDRSSHPRHTYVSPRTYNGFVARLDNYSLAIQQTLQQIASVNTLVGTRQPEWAFWETEFQDLWNMTNRLHRLLLSPTNIIQGRGFDSMRQYFPTVPTSLWRPRSERLRRVAEQSLLAVDPRIRDFIEAFMYQVEHSPPGQLSNTPPDDTQSPDDDDDDNNGDKNDGFDDNGDEMDTAGEPGTNPQPEGSNVVTPLSHRAASSRPGNPSTISVSNLQASGANVSNVLGTTMTGGLPPRRTATTSSNQTSTLARYVDSRSSLQNLPSKFSNAFSLEGIFEGNTAEESEDAMELDG